MPERGIGPMEADGLPDVYAPRDAIHLTNWSTSADDVSHIDVEAPVDVPGYADPVPFLGKVGHPAALPDGQLLVAYGVGPCGTVVGNRIFGLLGRPAPPLTSGSGQGT